VGVWISCVRWRPTDGEIIRYGRVWGSRNPGRPADEVTPELIASWLADGENSLGNSGDFVVEVVAPSSDDVDALTDFLKPVFVDTSRSIAEFVAMDRPVPSFSQFKVGHSGIEDSATTHFRAIAWLEFAGAAEPGEAVVVVRPLRIVSRDSSTIIAWHEPGGCPRYPDEDRNDRDALAPRLPGRMGPNLATQARLRGDPERLVEFEHGVGSAGPRSIPQMLSEWEDGGGSAGEFAEALLSRCVYATNELATENLADALNRWEAALLDRAREGLPSTSFALPALADLGAMLDIVEHNARTVGPPSDHDPDFYFTASPSSAEIEPAAERALSAVSTLRERVRTGLGLVSALSTSQVLEIAQEAQRSNERFQRVVGVLGAAILGPTLVVGLFGANTAIPGKDAWWGFGLMILLMIASVSALLGALRWLVSPKEK
jgi:CorA-like Mg2+ transporter protein